MRNLSSGEDIGFGVLSLHHSSQKKPDFEKTAKDVTALCMESDRLAMVVSSELSQSSDSLFAYYQPFTKDLLLAANSTGVNLIINGIPPIYVSKSKVQTTTERCSRFVVPV